MKDKISNLSTIILAVFLCTSSLFSLAIEQEKLIGDWEGQLAIGSAEIRLVFHIKQDDQGNVSATMDSPDQNAMGIPANAVEFTEKKLTIRITSIGGKFEGNVRDDFSQIQGHWNQGGQSIPLIIKPVKAVQKNEQSLSKEDVAKVSGIWQGSLFVSGTELRLVFKISANEKGEIQSTLDSPDQGAKDIPVSSAEVKSDSVFLQVAAIGGKYVGVLVDTDSLDGTWFQSGQSWPLYLKKVKEEIKINRPQNPKEPYPYQEEEVYFLNESADIDLAGTLTMPKGTGPFPAAILISGSGPQDRDENIMQHKPFLILADHLTRNGFAVLRYDDRGVAKSTGEFATATSLDFATDVLAAKEYLETRNEINHKQIGLIGHSEGGLIAPIVAIKDKDISYIVLIAGPALPGKEILLLQSELINRASGSSEEMIESLKPYSREVYATVISEEVDSIALTKMKTIGEKFWANLSEEDKESLNKLGTTKENSIMSMQQLLTPWFRFFLSYDPLPTLKKVECPVLVVIGEMDLQVPPKENIPLLKKALKDVGNKNNKVVELTGLNHLLQNSETGLPSEYGKIEETMSPKALNLISDWMKDIL